VTAFDPLVVSWRLRAEPHQVPAPELLGILQRSEGDRIEPNPLPIARNPCGADRLTVPAIDNDDGLFGAAFRRWPAFPTL
jgi:hypothetical protein